METTAKRVEDYPKGTAVAVPSLPQCDICYHVEKMPVPERALYDASTAGGSWANMCQRHFDRHHNGGLGIGLGQRLIVVES